MENKINIITGINYGSDPFTMECSAEVLDWDDTTGDITWNKDLYEITIGNPVPSATPELRTTDIEYGVALLNREQAEILRDSLNAFLSE